MAEQKYLKLNVWAFSLSAGISFAIFVFLLGLTSSFGWGDKFVEILSSAYIGYAPGLLGACAGAIWAFFDMGIGALIISSLYNYFSQK